MNNRVLVVIILSVFLISIFLFINLNINGGETMDINDDSEKRLFHGPVPEGYNEFYFRQSGITEPIEIN